MGLQHYSAYFLCPRRQCTHAGGKLTMAHAFNTLENTLRSIVLVTALAALLFPTPAWAADIVVLDDGILTLTVQQGVTSGQDLAASGPDYSAIAFGMAAPRPSCSVCLRDSPFAPWLESRTYDIPIL